MSVAKQDPAGRQAIKIGSDCLGMPTETTNPVIEIVHRDEQDIRPWLGCVQ